MYAATVSDQSIGINNPMAPFSGEFRADTLAKLVSDICKQYFVEDEECPQIEALSCLSHAVNWHDLRRVNDLLEGAWAQMQRVSRRQPSPDWFHEQRYRGAL